MAALLFMTNTRGRKAASDEEIDSAMKIQSVFKEQKSRKRNTGTQGQEDEERSMPSDWEQNILAPARHHGDTIQIRGNVGCEPNQDNRLFHNLSPKNVVNLVILDGT